MKSHENNIVNVGLIGCGEVTQVIHIPTLLLMNNWFGITYLCDISPGAIGHCASKIPGTVKTTRDPSQVCSSDEVDLVMVLNPDEYHSEHAILALRHDKHVFIEKPIALSQEDALLIADAERSSKGRVMVGYMRRYAAPFQDAIHEIGGMDKILYARVRDIIGPGATFVNQSGTFPARFTDFSPTDVEDKTSRAKKMIETAHNECGKIQVTDDSTRMWRNLCGLGSHDLSLMREALGMPEKVIGSSLTFPFWSVLFRYPGFTVLYESGRDSIPRFDAHLEVYSANKIVRVQYDTPYIKGLPVTVHIVENDNGSYKASTTRKSYEDPYTLEMKALWSMVVQGTAVKTTVQDAVKDLELFSMIMMDYYGKQECGSRNKRDS